MRAPFVMFSALLVLSGCAGGGQATPDDGERVTVVVVNEFDATVTAYAVWPGARPRRLGEISSGRERTFVIPRQGSEIAVGLELVSAPPIGTTSGPSGFATGSPPRINPEMVTSESMLIGPNEGIEWQLTPSGSLLFRRLTPQ